MVSALDSGLLEVWVQDLARSMCYVLGQFFMQSKFVTSNFYKGAL